MNNYKIYCYTSKTSRKHYIGSMKKEYAKSYLIIIAALSALCCAIIGCSDPTPNPIIEPAERAKNTAPLGIGTIKSEAPAAPQAPGVGAPSVKEVSYYADWKLTEKVTETVTPGTLLFVKIVFSEPMQHIAADDKSARPILYYKTDKKLTRFNIAAHGTGGEDFTPGDVKPLQDGTDDYVGKVKMPKSGTFTIAVGKISADTEGKMLTAFYTHKEKLQVKPKQDPVTVTEIGYYLDHDFTIPTLEKVYPGDIIWTKVVFSKAVPTVYAEDHTARPAIFYSIGTKKYQYRIKNLRVLKSYDSGDVIKHQRRGAKNTFRCKYTVQESDAGATFTSYVGDGEVSGGPLLVVHLDLPIPGQSPDYFIQGNGTTDRSTTEYWGIVPNPGDFSGYVLIPKLYRGNWVRPASQPIGGVTVTIIAGPRSGERTVTDRNGQYFFRNVQEDTLRLRVEKEHFEPKEVIVHRSNPTALADGTIPNYKGDPQKIPGNILIGQRWPDIVRPLLQQVPVVPDLLYIEANSLGVGGRVAAYYPGVVIMNSSLIFSIAEKNELYRLTGKRSIYHYFAHEIAHAHQHAMVAPDGSGKMDDWENTPEGIAFAEARRKDWREVGQDAIDKGWASSLLENAAEVCAHYWTDGSGTGYWKIRVVAPNRYKWAQEWVTINK